MLFHADVDGHDADDLAVRADRRGARHHRRVRDGVVGRLIPEDFLRPLDGGFVPAELRIVVRFVAVVHGQVDLARIAFREIGAEPFLPARILVRREPDTAAEDHVVRSDELADDLLGVRHVVRAVHGRERRREAVRLARDACEHVVKALGDARALRFEALGDIFLHLVRAHGDADDGQQSEQHDRENGHAAEERHLDAAAHKNPVLSLFSLWPPLEGAVSRRLTGGVVRCWRRTIIQNVAKDFSSVCILGRLQQPTTPSTASRSPSL